MSKIHFCLLHRVHHSIPDYRFLSAEPKYYPVLTSYSIHYTKLYEMKVRVIDPNQADPGARELVNTVHNLARAAGLPKMPEVGVEAGLARDQVV